MANKVKDEGRGVYSFYCPGCGHDHLYFTSGEQQIKWGFNGDLQKPSFTPSLLNRSGIHVPGYVPPSPEHNTGTICHLFVTDGVINYCGDCTHDHNGLQNVEMREV